MKAMSIVSVFLFVVSVSAQEGNPRNAADLKVRSPNAEDVQFENDWVKVTRVHYGPLEKLAAHAHTPRPSAYVYLNDGGPVRFKHIGEHSTIATRPATKAGAFRVYRGLDEIHEVENTSEAPSDFLRVELKTEPVSQDTFRGKFEREPFLGAGTAALVQLDHPQARMSRIRIAPGGAFTIRPAEGEPSLLIALVPTDPTVAIGQQRWLPAGHKAEIRNDGTRGAEFLRIQFRTMPQ